MKAMKGENVCTNKFAGFHELIGEKSFLYISCLDVIDAKQHSLIVQFSWLLLEYNE